MNRNYFDTFITVAPDTKVDVAKVPSPRGGKPTVAMLQYEMLSQPFVFTQEQVLFDVWLARQPDIDSAELADDEIEQLRTDFFAKGQACLRASPLTKTHGWGVIFDTDGKAALVAFGSPEYGVHAKSKDLKVLPAMRSSRAK